METIKAIRVKKVGGFYEGVVDVLNRYAVLAGKLRLDEAQAYEDAKLLLKDIK